MTDSVSRRRGAVVVAAGGSVVGAGSIGLPLPSPEGGAQTQ
jgi:hypothetical protein